MTSRVARRLGEIDTGAWNRLVGEDHPYLRHEFLSALETEGCLGHRIGWVPRHRAFEDRKGRLVAACPTYVKYNSFGEFVFDWAWADAYEEAGFAYYPKLVVAAPFTPATGPRLLLAPEARNGGLAAVVLNAMIEEATELGVSSLHWLFTTDAAVLESPRLLRRAGCQFHWENRDYASFEDFLSRMTSKRRKEILRERRQVREAGVELRRMAGNRVEPDLWNIVHELYCCTFAKHGNYPALTARFFQSIAATMGDRILLVLALRHGAIVGVGYFLVGRHTLYGRYWGCIEEIPALHFEACYYQGLEYCIETGLRRFEPGAQGEHKISRGFLPVPTWSAHWIAHPGFRPPIAHALEREERALQRYMAELSARSPYRMDGV